MKKEQTGKPYRAYTEVREEKGRRIKAAAAIAGQTVREWLEDAIDAKLSKEGA